MNSQLSKHALQAAAFIYLLQSSNSTPVIVELKRSDGTTIVGIVKDRQHFVDCHDVQIDILPGDKIAQTDRTCKAENGPDCRLCAYYPSTHDATAKAPVTPSGEVYANQPTAAMGASKTNSEVQNTAPKQAAEKSAPRPHLSPEAFIFELSTSCLLPAFL